MKQDSTTLSDGLAETIERDIYRGALAPGMWLKQIDLEERYGCTRLALRHALEQLQTRKIVRRVLNRGYYVPDVNEDNVREIMQARAYVEMSICNDLVKNINADSIAKLSYLAKLFADTIKSGTVLEQDEANHAFHRELLLSCPNKIMTEIIWELRFRIPITVQRTNNTSARLERSAREHFEMVEALRIRDAQLLKNIMASHVTYPLEAEK
ncbi:GntR family transcriptional regulator [Paenochrobactrum pullorum]|uniref:GntR family transcriptional regulator n=1 Tax=Paenochrobactrum pullorum TaxID=1324351 RepID=UPI0035BC364B